MGAWMTEQQAAKQRGVPVAELGTALANDRRLDLRAYKPPTAAKAQAPVRQPPRQAGVAQTGFNAGRQTVNAAAVTDRLGKDGRLGNYAAPGDGGRAAQDFAKSQQMNSAAQLRRGLEGENASQNMQNQAMRSELLQSAMANQAKIASDMAQRSVSQIGLASQIQNSLMKYRNLLFQSLTGQ